MDGGVIHMLNARFMKKLGICVTLLSLSSSALQASDLSSIPNTIATTEISAEEETDFIDYSQYITDTFLLPRNLYILQRNGTASERLDIFYRNALLTLSTTYNISSYSPYGTSVNGRWFFNSLQSSILPTESFPLNMIAKTENGFVSGTTNVELVDTTNTTPVRLLAIGDSLTRAGVYLSQINSKLPNITFLGTRSYPTDGIPTREGRGGWTLEKYFTCINSNELDSPFMFPVNVSSEHYKGNTRDWKAICYEKSNTAAYNGFQKLARGWKDEGEYLYNQNGYYKYPSIGDVMVDPSLPLGKQWVEWNGTSWKSMEIQPFEFEFNFTKYMNRNKEAFTEGSPTHVSILLGANEFGYNKEIDQIDLFISRLNQMIESIHTYDPSIKIILCLPTVAPNTSLVTSSQKDFYAEYDLRIKYAAARLLEAFDTDEALARQIYIAPMTLTLDATNGYDFIEKSETIDGFTSQVTDVKNSIHPSNTYGQLQMGDTLAAVIQRFR